MRGLGLLLALCALVAAGCGGGASMEEVAPPPETNAHPPPTAGSRAQAPPIAGETLDGERVSLADFRGRPVFVNVWSSW